MGNFLALFFDDRREALRDDASNATSDVYRHALLLLPGTDSLLPNSTSQKASHIVIQPNNFTLPGGSLIPVEYSCTRLTLFLLLIVLILIQMFDLPPSSLFLKVILHNSIKSVVGRPPRRIIAIRPCLLQEGLQKFFAAHPINKC